MQFVYFVALLCYSADPGDLYYKGAGCFESHDPLNPERSVAWNMDVCRQMVKTFPAMVKDTRVVRKECRLEPWQGQYQMSVN